MRPTMIRDQRFEIDILAPARGEPRVKRLGGFATGLSLFVGDEGALDDIGDRSTFAPRQTVGKVARAGAADGKLRFGHDGILALTLADQASAIKPSEGGMMATSCGQVLPRAKAQALAVGRAFAKIPVWVRA